MVKPGLGISEKKHGFLYSQGMSNGKTCHPVFIGRSLFLYSQGMSNGKTVP